MSIINWIKKLLSHKNKTQKDKYTELIKQLNKAVNRPFGNKLFYEYE